MTRTIVPGIGLVAMLGAAVAVVVHEPANAPVQAASASAQKSVELASGKLGAATAKPPTTVSRSAERPPLPNEAATEAKITGVLYATGAVAVYADSDEKSPELATIAAGDTVDVTGKTSGDWTQIMHKGAPRWVSTAALAKEEPLGTQPCPVGSEGGLQPDTVKVLRAVCAKFPQITSYGGIAGRGEHATGHSLDIMLGPDIGYDVAAYLQENRAKLGIEYLIYRKRIWRPATSAGWRGMSDRGGATANHMDHVHVTTYGSAATQ